MADPNNPTPTTPVVPDLTQALNQLGNFNNLFSALPEQITKVLRGITDFGTGVVSDFAKAGTAISTNTALLGQMGEAIVNLNTATRNLDLFSAFSQGNVALGTMNESLRLLGNNLQGLDNLIPNFAKTLGGNFAANVTAGQNLEAQFLSMAAAGGNLGEIFDRAGNITGDLITKSSTYAARLGDIANASGLTLDVTAKYAGELDKIPGILTQNVNLQGAQLGTIGAVTAALKVLSGSGQDFNTLLADMNKAYEDLGNAQGRVTDNGEKGLKFFSTMVTLSQDLNLRFSDTQKFLSEIASRFQLVGDNTEGAARVLNKYIDALRETGLTSKASIDVISGMIDGVSKLSTATKAFISLQSGGPGGLQGAAQIEQLLRAGNVDKVTAMVEQALRKQFGGRIVTQAEAATNQQSAAQFTRQRSLLTSGIFGNLTGGSEERATRLLEALATGNRQGAARVGREALGTVARQGETVQDKNTTILTSIANSSQLTAIATQLTALRLTQNNLSGQTNPAVRTIRSTAAERTTNRTPGIGSTYRTSEDPEEMKRQLAQREGELLKQFLSSIPSVTAGVAKIGAEGAKAVAGGAGAALQISKPLEQERETRKIRNNIVPIGPTTTPGDFIPSSPTNQPTVPRFSTPTRNPALTARLQLPTNPPSLNRPQDQTTPSNVNNPNLQLLPQQVKVTIDMSDEAKRNLRIGKVDNGSISPNTPGSQNINGQPSNNVTKNNPGY